MNIEQILKEVARYAKKLEADFQEIQAKTVEYDKKVTQMGDTTFIICDREEYEEEYADEEEDNEDR